LKLFRILLGVGLLLLAAFCLFGFLASFEESEITVWKLGYSIAGVACVVAAIWLFLKK
jgi:hypothetical protein